MTHAAPAGMLALPLALLAGALALVATSVATPADDGGARVELEIAGVLPMPEGEAGILVLREKGSETILPLLVPDGRDFLPGSYGSRLLGRAIEALGAEISEVEIERAEETSAGSRVRLLHGGRAVDLAAVPSESIALAMAAGVPIVTKRRLLDEAGLTPEDLARAHERARGPAQEDVRF
jgi:uncharacterized protein